MFILRIVCSMSTLISRLYRWAKMGTGEVAVTCCVTMHFLKSAFIGPYFFSSPVTKTTAV